MREAEAGLAKFGLSWEAFSLIVTLRRSGKPYALRPTDLIEESLLTSGAITNRIRRVEQLGLIKRIADSRDRRSCTVQLTPAGKRLADRAIAAHFERMSRLLFELSSSERRVLADLLCKLLVRFEGEKQEPSRVASKPATKPRIGRRAQPGCGRRERRASWGKMSPRSSARA
jgi:DNA-binding MarR family transcriptional regulator